MAHTHGARAACFGGLDKAMNQSRVHTAGTYIDSKGPGAIQELGLPDCLSHNPSQGQSGVADLAGVLDHHRVFAVALATTNRSHNSPPHEMRQVGHNIWAGSYPCRMQLNTGSTSPRSAPCSFLRPTPWDDMGRQWGPQAHP